MQLDIYKDAVRKLFNFLHLDFSLNLKYDRLTKAVIKKVLSKDSIGVDVGCHKGEIFELMVKYGNQKGHYAFEPIPYYYSLLNSKFGKDHNIFPYALADKSGGAIFNYVHNAPAYSGLKERKYDTANPNIEKIEVIIKQLDEVIPENVNISLIKIDVEGAEYGVLLGGKTTIERCKPVILFEFGLGASDVYETSPKMIFEYFSNLGYQIYLLDQWLNKTSTGLGLEQFETIYHNKKEFFFLADTIK